MNVKETQEKLKSGTAVTNLSNDEIKYAMTPIGKSIYKNSIGRPRVENKKKWNDRIVCDICGTEVLRSNQSSHKKSEKHLIYVNMNKKLRDILIE